MTKTILGIPEDSVGPGYYNSDKSMEKLLPKKSHGYKISSAERKTFFNRIDPLGIGPGQYETDVVHHHYESQNPNSIFASQVNRTSFGSHKSKAQTLLRERRNRQKVDTYLEDLESSSSDDENSPGPGNYDPYGNATRKKIKVRRDLQFFGSSEERFKRIKSNKRVGPGAYNQRHTNTMSQFKAPRLKVPFTTAADRFRYTSQSLSSPGPGSYITDTTASAKISKANKIKKKIKGVVFGFRQQRKSQFDSEIDIPGPGYYNGTMKDTIEQQTLEKQKESRNAYGRVIPKSSSMFLSSVKKDLSYVKKPYCNADYSSDIHTISDKINKTRKASLILPIRKLKKPDSRVGLRGPGYYKIKSFLETSKPYRKNSAFIAVEQRFKKDKETLPGPTDYQQTIL